MSDDVSDKPIDEDLAEDELDDDFDDGGEVEDREGYHGLLRVGGQPEGIPFAHAAESLGFALFESRRPSLVGSEGYLAISLSCEITRQQSAHEDTLGQPSGPLVFYARVRRRKNINIDGGAPV